MEIEILEAMNENLYLSLLMVIEVTVRIIVFFAIAGFAIYLAAVAWLCFEEMRRPARRQMKPAPMNRTCWRFWPRWITTWTAN